MDIDNPGPQIDFKALGQRLSALRAAHGWTLDELAERSGLSVSYLSRCETAVRQPSLTTLSVLAHVFGITLAELFEPEDDPCIIVRGDEAPVHRGNDLMYTLLSRRSRDVSMQAIKITVGAQPTQFYSHEGEEWLYVLRGRLYLRVGEEEHILQTGDAAHFRAQITHQFAADVEGITEILLVACVTRHPLLRGYL